MYSHFPSSVVCSSVHHSHILHATLSALVYTLEYILTSARIGIPCLPVTDDDTRPASTTLLEVWNTTCLEQLDTLGFNCSQATDGWPRVLGMHDAIARPSSWRAPVVEITAHDIKSHSGYAIRQHLDKYFIQFKFTPLLNCF